jgi:hypothetical protein
VSGQQRAGKEVVERFGGLIGVPSKGTCLLSGILTIATSEPEVSNRKPSSLHMERLMLL